ncbi:hypothetical protein [Streptomyces sp. NPDC005438]|uniref:hypothetical protein n=1 Tax=Streptomyces sp. NPDC005438 TaxID=3156880 RepID=UPI0033B53B4C
MTHPHTALETLGLSPDPTTLERVLHLLGGPLNLPATQRHAPARLDARDLPTTRVSAWLRRQLPTTSTSLSVVWPASDVAATLPTDTLLGHLHLLWLPVLGDLLAVDADHHRLVTLSRQEIVTVSPLRGETPAGDGDPPGEERPG